MSTTIPIQDLDPSTSPPSDHTIRAVVTLSWPYSSSTRQCALLLSERDFRLRARGGQIRVKFSGPAARAVAGSKLGIGDEVLLELGAGEWSAGAPVHVPGKSVGELHFERGVRLRVQKEDSDEVEVSVEGDVMEDVEAETSHIEIPPARIASPVTNFRSSIGGAPGSAAIYSSPAYMRKAAKFSYLDGISRLFEDEWDNQDLPRKKARTSMGDVKSWKVVDRTPSPEPLVATDAAPVEETMVDAGVLEHEHLYAEVTTGEDSSPVASVSGQGLAAEMHSARSSPTPAPKQQDLQPASQASAANPLSSPPQLLAAETLEEQHPVDTQATIDASELPGLRLPSASPTPQPREPEDLKKQVVDPITPRLIPLSSAALPSTTPQISPLPTKVGFTTETRDDSSKDVETMSDGALPSGGIAEEEAVVSTSPTKATESLLDQLKSTAGESEPATEPILPEQDDIVDVHRQWETDDLAEEDAFSDDETNEVLSAHENDDELMLEEDAEDVFDADELEGGEPSDDDTDEDFEMHQLPAQQWLEESTTEKDSDVEEQASVEDQMDSEMTTQPRASTVEQQVSQPPGFAPASTLLHATQTPAKVPQPPVVTEENKTATPPRQPFFGLDGAVPSTEEAEVTTPAAKPTGTPKSTPQSVRDKVMKRTFSSLFGIKATPSPEKEDMPKVEPTTGTEQVILDQADQHMANVDAVEAEELLNNAVNDSHRTHTTALDVSGPSLESAAIEEAGPQELHELQMDAAPQDSTLHATNELPDQTSHDVQEDVQPEPASSTHAQFSELIDLDSSSVAEDNDEENDDPSKDREGEQTMDKPSIPTLTPRRRSVREKSEVHSPAVVDSDPAEKAATVIHESIFEPATLETVLPEMGEQIKQVEDLNNEQIAPVESYPEFDMLGQHDAGTDVFQQEDIPEQPELVTQSEQLVPDSLGEPSTLSPMPRSPTVELGLQAQMMPDHMHQHVDVGVSADVDEVSPERSGVSGSLRQEEFGDAAPAITDNTTDIPRDVEVVGPSQDHDVEMTEVARQEPESSQASFQSQVIHDSIDAHTSGLHENSSRPTSRGTAEDFSPMVLGSMAQRVTDIVSDESSMMRLRELQSQDVVEIDQNAGEALDIPSMANFIEEDMLEQTPTRSTKAQGVEIASSPSESHAISPVRYTRATQEQEPTPQATFDGDVQGPNAPNEDMDLTQDAPEDPVLLSASDAQALESQFKVTELAGERAKSPSPQRIEQNDLPDIIGENDEQAYLTLPLSPSATQSADHKAQLSHATRTQVGMQPTPATSQLQSELQPHTESNLLETSEPIANMPQVRPHEQEGAKPTENISNASHVQSLEKEPTSMPPPEQAQPPKTPARKSLRSRLSNVPDVISAWFSPKRSSIVAQEPEESTTVETPLAASVKVTQKTSASKRRASGLSTAHAYFTSLASLSQYVNPSSQQAGTVDVLAVVTDFAKEPERAKGGPRDYYTIFRVTDPSMSNSADVRVEVFRPWKAVLPAADIGDVVLLRAFVVKSKKRQPYLLSTDASAWCVWRFAEHSKATARGGAVVKDGEKPAWARRMSHIEVREEVKGPPVEYGMAEKEQARKLRDWWAETHSETEGGATEELVGEDRGEEEEVVEL